MLFSFGSTRRNFSRHSSRAFMLQPWNSHAARISLSTCPSLIFGPFRIAPEAKQCSGKYDRQAPWMAGSCLYGIGTNSVHGMEKRPAGSDNVRRLTSCRT